MSSEEKRATDAKETEVFDQELSLDDLDAAAGGSGEDTYYTYVCDMEHFRYIYGRGAVNGDIEDIFPNCAATVEEGSWCKTNDACYSQAIEYHDTKECAKAWR